MKKQTNRYLHKTSMAIKERNGRRVEATSPSTAFSSRWSENAPVKSPTPGGANYGEENSTVFNRHLVQKLIFVLSIFSSPSIPAGVSAHLTRSIRHLGLL